MFYRYACRARLCSTSVARRSPPTRPQSMHGQNADLTAHDCPCQAGYRVGATIHLAAFSHSESDRNDIPPPNLDLRDMCKPHGASASAHGYSQVIRAMDRAVREASNRLSVPTVRCCVCDWNALVSCNELQCSLPIFAYIPLRTRCFTVLCGT
jgi:hypothetical protein